MIDKKKKEVVYDDYHHPSTGVVYYSLV